MPPIRSLGSIADGFQITHASGAALSITKANVPAGTLAGGNIAQIDAALDSRLTTLAAGRFNARAHVTSLSPFLFMLQVSNFDVPIPDNWWVKA
jgi:hypothetical protein